MKRGFYGMVVLFATFMVAGCNKEDDLIIVTADFTEFIVENQVDTAYINPIEKSVTVFVSDSAAMRNVKVIDYKVTNNASLNPHIAPGDTLDLTEPLVVYLQTRQEYMWIIKAEMVGVNPIEIGTVTIQNMNFDHWYLQDDKHWYPDKDLSTKNYWWDTGNKGANLLGPKNPTSPETSFVVSGTAAKLHSTTVMGVLASGSIFLGRYVKTSGLGAELSMGRDFDSRPVALKGYYCYHPGIVDKVKSPYGNMEGKKDYCSIYIVLGDWKSRVKIDTNEGTFLDIENDPNIIAYAELSTNEDSGSEYLPFRLPLEYRNDRTPTQILIVASSCKYGDYFTGSSNSLLYIDEFSLEY